MTSSKPALLAATACALLAAVLTYFFLGSASGDSTDTVAVLVSERAIEAGEVPDSSGQAFARTRSFPAALAPADAISDPVELAGRAALIDLPVGAALAGWMFSGTAERSRFRLRAGERAVSVDVALREAGGETRAGSLVDLFASGIGGDQQTALLLSGAEVLAATPDEAPGRSELTLRLAADQVAAVVRADLFARELRAIVSSKGTE